MTIEITDSRVVVTDDTSVYAFGPMDLKKVYVKSAPLQPESLEYRLKSDRTQPKWTLYIESEVSETITVDLDGVDNHPEWADGVDGAKLCIVDFKPIIRKTIVGSGGGSGVTSVDGDVGPAVILPDMVGDSGAGGVRGYVPAPAAGDAAADKYLKADGTWEVPPPETLVSLGTLINSATAKTTPVDTDMLGLMDSAAANILKKLSWANVKATLKAYFDTLYAPIPSPSFLTYTGGAQVNSTTTLANIDSSAAWAITETGLYEFVVYIRHDSAGTATGACFTVNGPASNFVNTIVLYDTLNTQESFVQTTYNWGAYSLSSKGTTNNRVSLISRIRFTATGTLSLRFRSEVAGQAITVRDVTGYMRKISS